MAKGILPIDMIFEIKKIKIEDVIKNENKKEFHTSVDQCMEFL